jgi:hypothetical protein
MKTKPYAHLQAINTINRVNENELLECISEMQKQLKVLAEAVQELAKEVHANREFIERQAELSTKTVDVLKSLTT